MNEINKTGVFLLHKGEPIYNPNSKGFLNVAIKVNIENGKLEEIIKNTINKVIK